LPIARIVLYLASVAGVGLMVQSLISSPPPLFVAVVALLAYLGLITCGVLFSRFSMFADVVTFGPRDARGVALTFDDGPHPESTPQILDMLEQAGARATFFVIGHKVDAHPDLAREIVERGHALGVHGYAHDRLFALRSPKHVRNDLERAVDAIHRCMGKRPMLFRAPIGHISPSVARVVRGLELIVVGWSVGGMDGWPGAKPDVVAQRVIPKLRDGAIVLLHDASERDEFVPASVEALPQILEAAEKLNLSFVRVDSWLGQGDEQQQRAAHDQQSE